MTSKYWVLILAGFSVMLAPAARAETISYAFTPQSSLTYHVTHPFHHVEGVSHTIKGLLSFDFRPGQRPRLLLPAVLQAPIASFWSGNANRDGNMQTILNAASYPEATLKLGDLRWEASDAKTLKGTADGTLSLHGQSLPVVVSLAGDADGRQLKVKGHFSFSLRAFGIERPSLLFLPIDDRVKMDLDATALAQR